ncbi:MAG: hypothetical protein AAGI07_02565 [Bacteroidota bacterium]
MKTDLIEIQNILKSLLTKHVPPLQIRKDNENVFELAGTKEAMQGRQKVDGFYFGSVVPKPKDIRLYFFPIYTHPEKFHPISEALNKFLKGKSCFHIKRLSPELEKEIDEMITLGVNIYKKNELI